MSLLPSAMCIVASQVAYLIHQGDIVCVHVFTMRVYHDKPVKTKLGMVFEGPKAERSLKGSWRPAAHVQ